MRSYKVTFYELPFIGGTQETPFEIIVEKETTPTQEELRKLYLAEYNNRHKNLSDRHIDCEIKTKYTL